MIRTPSVISSSSRPGCQAGLQQDRVHQCRQVPITELHRRQIHADLQGRSPGGRLATGLAQRPFADLADHAVLLGKRDKGRLAAQARAWGEPAQQRFKAEHLAVDLGLRLVVESELAMCHGRAEIVL